eukprot:5881663-Pleurochrysis_carterae.AAC.1
MSAVSSPTEWQAPGAFTCSSAASSTMNIADRANVQRMDPLVVSSLHPGVYRGTMTKLYIMASGAWA